MPIYSFGLIEYYFKLLKYESDDYNVTLELFLFLLILISFSCFPLFSVDYWLINQQCP